jgi:hypothetical protein
VKEAEIHQCLRLYRKAVDSYSKLLDKLAMAQAAMYGMPGLRQTRQRLLEAEADLSRIGEGISVVPELTEELLAEKRSREPAGCGSRRPAEDDDGLLA